MQKLKWYYDFISPFAYLQFKTLHRLKHKVQIEYVPVLFAGLLNHWENVGPAEIEPKRIHTFRFCQWYANRNDIAFRIPETHPFNPLIALRLSISHGLNPEVIGAIFETIWVRGKVPSSDRFADCVAELSGHEIDPGLSFTDGVKNQLKDNTEQAINDGIFGVPTCRVNSENFWGLDSLELLNDYMDAPELFEGPDYARIQTTRPESTRR